jgi:hypothetical protein
MTEPSVDLVFISDPERFMEILRIEDRQARAAALSNADDLAICEIMRYGHFNDERMIGPLRSFYQQAVLPLPEDRRFSIFNHIKSVVEDTEAVSANAFLPFMVEDDSRLLVSTAVIDYVSLSPLTDNDPMSRVKDVIGMIERGLPLNAGAAFGALLNLGDERVCRLLVPLRDALRAGAVEQVINTSTGFLYAATVDFYLDWLEGLEGDDADGLFGHVAAGLGLIKRKSRFDQVFTGLRPFPFSAADQEQKMIPMGEYLKRIAPRMYALERSEPPPRVMPHVIAAWGLEPVTDLTEAVDFGDRSFTSLSRARTGQNVRPRGPVTVNDEWWDGNFQIYLCWGILNPNGPTLYCLGTRGEGERGRTFHRWLHFLGGSTTYATETKGPPTYGSIFEDAVAIHNHLLATEGTGIFHAIPSFLISNQADDTVIDMASRLLARGGAAQKADWGRQIAYQRQFGTDFFEWARAEFRAYHDRMVAEALAKGEEPSQFVKALEYLQLEKASVPVWDPSPFTPELYREWIDVVRTQEHARASLQTLRSMWEGGAGQVRKEDRRKDITFDRVAGFLVDGGFRLPG